MAINKNILILLLKLNKILAVLNWKWYNPENLLDIEDLLVCLTNWLRQDKSTNTSHFAYLANNFNIKKPVTYKKTIVSDQAKE